jgi:hypothetical protein
VRCRELAGGPALAVAPDMLAAFETFAAFAVLGVALLRLFKHDVR